MPSIAVGTPEPSLVIALLSFLAACVPLYIVVFNRPQDARKGKREEKSLAGQLEDQLLDNAGDLVAMANQQADRERERANRSEAKADALAERVAHLERTIKDQGDEGSCTGFSLSSAREALLGADRIALSPAFIYYEERRIERSAGRDSGAMIRDGLKVLAKEGVCPEDAMPYVAGQYTTPPGPGAFDAATGYRIAAYHRATSLHALQAAIAARHPVVLGISVYRSFEENVGPDGKVPMPAPGEELRGGHAILVVGYRRDAKAPGGGWLTLNNSWGVGAGKGGQFFLPYAYAVDRRYTFETWVIEG
jgi:hypothetical protein